MKTSRNPKIDLCIDCLEDDAISTLAEDLALEIPIRDTLGLRRIGSGIRFCHGEENRFLLCVVESPDGE